ncbi:MAG: SDR family oxidoreductase [Flavobacteriales bacterium]|nr:SDR family oxidoreductase [Flavobacteriales bacterium]MCB9190689.1 SDR family oxidoreductase [Flavobacteriales bacterium]
MNGKQVVITGGNAGIGKATAIALAKKGANVIITSRSESKAKAAVDEIKAASKNENIDFVLINLVDQESVRKAAEEIKSKCPKIDVLINNAGCYLSDLELSPQGIEGQFATNHIGHFLLTNLLLENIKAAGNARIINLASIAHKSTRALNFDDLNYEKEEYGGWKSYSRSKFCNILFTKELARRLEGTGITANAVHPGGVRTEIAEKDANWYTKLGWIVMKPFMITVEDGAKTSIHLASSADVEGETGGYWVRSKKEWSNRPSQDPELAKALWKKSEELVGQEFPESKFQ